MWLRCLKALKQQEIVNAKKGRCGSQFYGSPSKNEVETDPFCGKNVRKKL